VKSKTPNFTIRRAEIKDAQALASLFADETMLASTDVPACAGVAYWEKRLASFADVAHLPLVAVIGDAIIGLLLLQGLPNHIRRKHSSVLQLLAVHPKHRRIGVGRALVNAATHACDDWLNVRRIEVSIVASRMLLKGFYETLGFAEEGVRTCDLMDAGRYTDLRVMSRLNPANMPAPASTPIAIPRRRKQAPAKFSIRAATSDDADGFAQVFASRGAAAGTLQHPYTSPDIWRSRLAPNTSTRQAMFVALANGKQVGNAGVHPVSDNPRQQHVCGIGLGVVDAYQSRGIGRALMEACLDYADHWANYARVELTVHADNARAIKLYQSLGFVVEGRHRDFSFREGGYVDALFMGRLTHMLRTSN
jgi:L-phenylalanine/L-methionine N-acetyltransferase